MPIHVHHDAAFNLAPMVNITSEDRIEALSIALENCRTLADAMTYWSDWHEAWQSAFRRKKLFAPHVWQLRLQMIEARCKELRAAA